MTPKKKKKDKKGMKQRSPIIHQKNDIWCVWILILITAYALEKLPKYIPL